MKSKFLLIIGALALTAFQANAQNVSEPTATAAKMESANSDYVTIGSRVPYYVPTDPDIQTLTTAGKMKESIFKWSVTDAAATPATITVPFLNYTGTAAAQYDKFRASDATGGYYDNEISLEWKTANGFAEGNHYKVNVAERSVTLSSTIEGCEDVTPEVKDVYVLAQPTVAFDGNEGGGCGVGTSFYVPLKITGLGKWIVTYTVNYNGTGASGPATYSLTVADPTGIDDSNVITESTTTRNAAGTPTGKTDGLKIDLTSGQYGYYDIAITNISDKISGKALNNLPASAATGTYRIYVNPTPATQAIQHLKTL